MIEAHCSDILGAKKSINHYITVSNFQKQQLIKLGIPEDRLSVLHHFINTIGSPIKEGQYFFYAGRILENKGIKILLDAYALLKKRPPLKIAGDGIEIDFWKKYCSKINIHEEVEWLGFKDGTQLSELYAGCLATINPSLLNETFGLTCLEALSRGRPVIASNIGALPEVISDGIDGILIRPGDIQELHCAMANLIDNPAAAFDMGNNGLQKVKKMFTKEFHYESLLSIYKKVSNHL